MSKLFRHSFAVGLLALSVIQPLHATVFLDLVPSSVSVTTGEIVNIDITISGLGNPPSVGAFDLEVAFDPAVLSFPTVVFGPFLGDPLLLEALTSVAFPGPGTVELAEVSLLSPLELDTLQSSSFLLATISLTAITDGMSALTFVGQPLVDDAFGNKLISEPATLLLCCLGLIALIARRNAQAPLADA